MIAIPRLVSLSVLHPLSLMPGIRSRCGWQKSLARNLKYQTENVNDFRTGDEEEDDDDVLWAARQEGDGREGNDEVRMGRGKKRRKLAPPRPIRPRALAAAMMQRGAARSSSRSAAPKTLPRNNKAFDTRHCP